MLQFTKFNVFTVGSLIFIFSIIRTLDYPDYLGQSPRVGIIEIRLYKVFLDGSVVATEIYLVKSTSATC